MRKIAVFTGTRAEYGLLFWLMKGIQNDPELELQIIVSAMHLAPQFGETWKEIEADGFKIDAKVEMLLASDSAIGVVKSMGLASIGFADSLARLQPDLLVILGDRFEALAAAQTALIMKIPIAHLHGGELTLGAYDNSIRHAITKMSCLHFTAAERYRQRIIQMGEDGNRVFNVGAVGLEHVVRTENYSLQALAANLNIPLCRPYVLVTYHPETLSHEVEGSSFELLLKALDEMRDYQVLFTYPNADNGGHAIIQQIQQYCKINAHRAFAAISLGSKRYLSAVAHAEAVIGNSSSGVIEVPAFGIPTVNIGNRQEGRLAADSVIHCPADYNEIKKAISKAVSVDFKAQCKNVINPYGDGWVSERIIPVLKTHRLSVAKRFYDLDFSYE
ncbi:UDP-N-acetylglucosamine 2-epimerase [Legionella fallonii]|uniref:GDP/UDP-N,N'-diacetylbacillosamine 2-epimerase (Hydrolyzing) n=1 Tax=Legionella fallonii LLAP-10 TaxID=1212491 RepID=A0A098G433_9GAMM|nr:UDP-N-acetylglucosamine 2-epimerase [Legionella fallonii]CEG56245.1 GDP/UDP-N,N'-diacetylbacillosamine 2-epimerase (hydrolyzing) [Legionella fallonii LLAP-10]